MAIIMKKELMNDRLLAISHTGRYKNRRESCCENNIITLNYEIKNVIINMRKKLTTIYLHLQFLQSNFKGLFLANYWPYLNYKLSKIANFHSEI